MLTAVSNNAGSGENGLGKVARVSLAKIYSVLSGKLLHSGQIDKMMASYIGGCVRIS